MAVLQQMKNIAKKTWEYLTYENTKECTRRRFRFYILFGEIKNDKLPWSKSEWNETHEPLLRKILQSSPEQKNTGIRVLEYKKMNGNSAYYTDCKLGRLKWDEK